MNLTVLAGRLTKDPEMRHTGSGTAVASFTLAVDRPFTKSNGERETDFINCVAWRKTAEHISNYYSKGDGITVTNGRIQTRNYDNNEGKKVYVTEVIVEQVEFPLGNSKKNDGQSRVAPKKEEPFTSGVDISDDSLPFDY